MVIDTSAIISILVSEPEAERLSKAIDRDSIRLMSAATVLESAIVLHNLYGDAGSRELDLLIQRLGLEIRVIDHDQLEWARYACQKYGRGRHSAKLNFGDCFSYALSKSTGEPLLFNGNDFSRTDLISALTT